MKHYKVLASKGRHEEGELIITEVEEKSKRKGPVGQEEVYGMADDKTVNNSDPSFPSAMSHTALQMNISTIASSSSGLIYTTWKIRTIFQKGHTPLMHCCLGDFIIKLMINSNGYFTQICFLIINRDYWTILRQLAHSCWHTKRLCPKLHTTVINI